MGYLIIFYLVSIRGVVGSMSNVSISCSNRSVKLLVSKILYDLEHDSASIYATSTAVCLINVCSYNQQYFFFFDQVYLEIQV